MITIVDYGAGNLKSVEKAFEFCGAQVKITDDPNEILLADALVLPGVGSFGDAMYRLHERGIVSALKQYIASGKPFMGICLGMQLLFEGSEESEGVEGLGILKGSVKKFIAPDAIYKIPHMGWNNISVKKQNKLINTDKEPYVYFVHSYYCDPQNTSDILTTTNYIFDFCSSVNVGNLYVTQFHPEKSGTIGIAMISSFIKIAGGQ